MERTCAILIRTNLTVWSGQPYRYRGLAVPFKRNMQNPNFPANNTKSRHSPVIKVWILFYLFNPQKSINEPSVFFHFFETFFSASFSSVERALILSSVVMSRYFMVVSRFECPSKKLT